MAASRIRNLGCPRHRGRSVFGSNFQLRRRARCLLTFVAFGCVACFHLEQSRRKLGRIDRRQYRHPYRNLNNGGDRTRTCDRRRLRDLGRHPRKCSHKLDRRTWAVGSSCRVLRLGHSEGHEAKTSDQQGRRSRFAAPLVRRYSAIARSEYAPAFDRRLPGEPHRGRPAAANPERPVPTNQSESESGSNELRQFECSDLTAV